MTDMTVANEIKRQLGGGRFDVMTGCKNYSGDANSLSFKLPRNASKATHMRITLTPMDVYKIEALRCDRRTGITVVATEEDIYNIMLQSTFTRMTGLDTHL